MSFKSLFIEPSDHEYIYGIVPPRGVKIISPSFDSKHMASFTNELASRASGSVKVMLVSKSQLFASVIVTV